MYKQTNSWDFNILPEWDHDKNNFLSVNLLTETRFDIVCQELQIRESAVSAGQERFPPPQVI